MATSIALAVYLALRRGGVTEGKAAPPSRPPGPLIWAHCPDPDSATAFVALADRLATDGELVHMLITMPDVPANAPTGSRVILQAAPPDLSVPVRAFLDHWKPNLLLWSKGNFSPVLLSEVGAEKLMGRYLVDASSSHVGLTNGSWIPGATKSLLGVFDRALAVDDDAAQRLQRAGMEMDRIDVTGPLGTIAGVIPCNERERRDLAQTLGSRPVWLAAGICRSELPQVIEAHRLASRTAHRLLLIAVPRTPEEAQPIADGLREAGFRLALRAESTEPDEATQVYLVDNLSEMGLWYRLAPISFMGGTLTKGATGRHPFEAASLGSAVLHGPETDPYAAYYLRLARAGASRSVRGGADLGQAVEALLAPDKVAAMAHAAWDVTTAGADVGNRVIDLIRDALDRMGG